MVENNWPNRIYSLDISRGVAALSVVTWHWQHFAFKGTLLSSSFERINQPFYEILKLFYEKGDLAVKYFFVLSGFIFFWLYKDAITSRKINIIKFGVQRFSRLYPLHFATLIIVMLLQKIHYLQKGSSFVYPNNDTFHFLLNLGFASTWGFERGWSFNAPVWSVSIEILLYLIFFIVAYNRLGGKVFTISVSMLAFFFSLIIKHNLFEGLALFFLGGFVYQLTVQITNEKKYLKPLIYFITLIAWSSVIVNYYFFNIIRILLDVGGLSKIIFLVFPYFILFPFTICSLVLIEIDQKLNFKRFSWVGEITYSLYLLHFPLQIIFKLLVNYGLLNETFFLKPIYLILYFLILIPTSYIVNNNFEKPLLKAIRAKMIEK